MENLHLKVQLHLRLLQKLSSSAVGSPSNVFLTTLNFDLISICQQGIQELFIWLVLLKMSMVLLLVTQIFYRLKYIVLLVIQ